MRKKRILTIQDISCVGKCSVTVALPVLSAWGHETCVLPTMLLSTHTGGFGKPEILSFGQQLESFWRHWQKHDIQFDGILTGYLGSCEAVQTAVDILDRFLAPGGIGIVDPAMADHGKLYSGLGEDYAQAITALCRRADILLPNLTEAAILAGDMPDSAEKMEPRQLLDRLPYSQVVLTGVESGPEEMEILLKNRGQIQSIRHRRTAGRFCGTGDLFAACFTGALLHGMPLDQAISIAGELTYQCTQITAAEPESGYGICFEAILPDICRYAEKKL